MSHALTFEWADGRTARVDARPDETVVEAAERESVALPFGCLTGACATCTARLLDGHVAYRRPPRGLKPDQREAGYVLACVAEPRSDCRLRVGVDVHRELVDNPWK
ncbi:2Fe-2S iron-sulfur cluster-binding protein [Halomarina ordinaria]|uniref:2Fe-2S iron-sulfur cluster-binding protein n=1 Tax=Halomarina ordinaria TaxID=3033939 RepID=A0ABD5U6I4_9EURY|nr:2Fe-2S iron-sulfur cluster binding domain-containing protein [Halomarina sp. PSRA2]